MALLLLINDDHVVGKCYA